MILILLAALGGIGYYLTYRLYRGFASFFPGLRFWPVPLIAFALVLIIVLGFGRALMPFPKDVKHILGLLGGYCMGIALYLLLFTVAADLLLLVPRLMKLSFVARPLFKGFVTLGVLLATLVTCVYGFVNARQIDHVSYEIRLYDKKDISDMKLVMISDLHLGAIGSEGRLEKIVNEINAQNPDVVCIAGDFFDTDFSSIRDPEAALQALHKLKATYGIYACAGNHDGGQTYEQMKAFLRQADIKLLDDAYTVIDNRLVLVGRLDGSAIGGYGEQKRKELSDFFTREDMSLPVIVLDHNPANIHEYGDEADLILCGHTHKGQVFPANLFTHRMYTVDYGYYQRDADSPQVVVSSGVGTWGMPMRVGTDCEIVTIRFSCDT